MAKYRIGKDLPIKWTLMNGDSPYDLTGRNFKVWLICYGWKMEITDRSVAGNVISFTFWGKDQEELGDYYLLYDENNGRPAMLTHDAKAMFTLVPHSWEEGGEDPDEIEIDAIEVTSNVNIAGDANVIEVIKVNGVEQPVVDKAVDIAVPTELSELAGDDTHRTVTDAEKAAWNAKYNKPASGIPASDLADGVIPDVSDFVETVTPAVKKIWTGTQAQYDALTPTDDTIYFIKED